MPLTRVVKVGGSLLDWPPLPQAIKRWLDDQPPACNVLLCGGGAFVDEVRRLDERFGLGDEAAHWLAIGAMSLTARVLAAMLGEGRPLTKYSHLLERSRHHTPSLVIFDVADYLATDEPTLPGKTLPHDWTVTSDAIAHRLAQTIAADELVLLKSADPPASTLPKMAAAGYIDGYLGERAPADRSRPRLINLRSFA
jgi:aspartokinase-like uncharacterized kinase